jgi:ATP synthase protein I
MKGKKAPAAIFQLIALGTQLVACTFAGLAIGYYLDRKLGTAPWLTLALLVLGITAGFLNMYKMAKRYGGSG